MSISTVVTEDLENGKISPGGIEERKARVVAITSGKGGVGKTNIATNLGIALAANKKQVCIFDADMGLANINILIGKTPEYTIDDLLSGKKEIDDVLIKGPAGIQIVPASTGLDRVVSLAADDKKKLVDAYQNLEKRFDYLLIDTSAGISETVLSFIHSSHDAVIVVSPEPTSLTDAYSLVKVLDKKGFDGRIFILVNMVLSYADSVKIFKKFNAATKKYLNLETNYLGFVLMDQAVIASVIQQSPIMQYKPESVACRCINSIAAKFESHFSASTEPRFSEYWDKRQDQPMPAVQEEEPVNDGPITPPQEIKEKFAKLQSLSADELVGKVIQEIEKGTLDQETVKGFIQKIESAFTNQYNRYPHDLKSAIYASLEMADSPREAIEDLHLFIERLYEKRFEQSLYDVQDVFLKLMEESNASANTLKSLHQLLATSYRRRFDEPIVDMEDLVRQELSKEDFYEQGFADFITTIKEIYGERFGSAYKEPIDLPIAQVEEEVNQLRGHDRQLLDLAESLAEMLTKRQERQERLTGIIEDYISQK